MRVAGATLISSGEVVSSEFVELSVNYFCIKTQVHSKCYTVTIVVLRPMFGINIIFDYLNYSLV